MCTCASGKLGQAPGVIEIEVRGNDMAYVVASKAQALDLGQRGLARIEAGGAAAQERATQAHRVGEVVRAEARVDEDQARAGLEEQAVAHEAGPFEEAPLAEGETGAGRAHGSAIDVVNSHGSMGGHGALDPIGRIGQVVAGAPTGT